jgi:Tfp pilus assembly protein PilN
MLGIAATVSDKCSQQANHITINGVLRRLDRLEIWLRQLHNRDFDCLRCNAVQSNTRSAFSKSHIISPCFM